jgi:hypothetical protein
VPPNQFNMDLCLDSISVLNRIPKQGHNSTPYEVFMQKDINMVNDFRIEWGKLIKVKKPEGVSLDLNSMGSGCGEDNKWNRSVESIPCAI